MTNIFSYLKDEREAREKHKQQKAQEARLKEEDKLKEEKILKKAVEEAKLKYNELVMNILRQLTDAAYPDYEVEYQQDDVSWIIYDEHEIDSGGDYQPMWTRKSKNVVVSVKIKFDKENKPISFICKRGKKDFQSGLTHDELVQALRKLHPAGQA